MTAAMELVTRLQTLDAHIAELQRAIAALPRHIAEIEKALDSHLRRLEADRAALAANLKERKSLEDDNKVHEQKISKLRDQMLGAKTNEQYRAFQNEIDFCANAIRKAEDRMLDLMGESEPLDANVKTAEVALKAEKSNVEAEKAEARLKSEADKKRLRELQAERADMAGRLEPKLLKAYEHQRKKWGSTTVVEAVEGRCTGCQISLRPQFLQDLRRGDQVMSCETCGRILFYNPPVSFEQELATEPHGA
ncbi:MAG: C4-type zinc ribbon domain-containing protein [Bryobacteraceae bacterium]|jgi:predicted  nucleic acid-binding Zn-ribbon protein